jgi:GYF domain 2
MLYHVSRNGQTYGPYTLDDLKKYVASGNVLPTDLARSEEMGEWLPVGQILGGAQSVAFQQPVAAPYPPVGYAPGAAAYPDPPNLHWALVLLLAFFTCSIFMWVWNFMIASWMKRVQPNSKAIFYYAAAAILLFLQIVFSSHGRTHFVPGMHMGWQDYGFHPLSGSIGLVAWAAKLIARFTLRSELEEHFNTAEPIGLSLSGVMTFFFGGLYFQYHLHRINEMKRMARYGGAAI